MVQRKCQIIFSKRYMPISSQKGYGFQMEKKTKTCKNISSDQEKPINKKIYMCFEHSSDQEKPIK